MSHSTNGNAVTLHGAHRTVRDKTASGGGYYIRWTGWRGAGAPVLGNFKGATQAEAEAAEKAGAAEIAARYHEERSGEVSTRSVGGVLIAFERSADFKGLSESTQTVWKHAIRHMRDGRVGEMRTLALRANGATRALTRWRDSEAKKRGPRAADLRLQVLKRALNWAKNQGIVGENPALGIEDVYRSDRSDLIWEPEHIEKFVAEITKRRAAIMETGGPNRAKALHALQIAHDTLMLAMHTGLRREDLAQLNRKQVRDVAIVLSPLKAARRARTASKRPRVVVIPILPEIRPIIDRRLAASDIMLPTYASKKRPGRHYSASGLGRLVAGISVDIELGLHLHDARGSFVTRARGAGLSREEVADILGWAEEDVRQIERRYSSNDAVVSATLERLRRQ